METCLRCDEESERYVEVWDAEDCELCDTHIGYVCIDCIDEDDYVTCMQIDPRDNTYVANVVKGKLFAGGGGLFALEGKIEERDRPGKIAEVWRDFYKRFGLDWNYSKYKKENI